MAGASTVLTITALEGGLEFLLTYPRLVPERAVPLFRKYYRNLEWVNLQLDPRCAVYDPEVTYILRPGEFRFGNREFDNAYSVNRLGLRDDEASLVQPEIIVLGDSHTMGWAVEQDEIFTSLLEQATRRRVLNAGIPSFGTVRELKLLERLDTSALKTLIIQYCGNDMTENRSWQSGGGRLTISSRTQYEQLSRGHMRSKNYFFGRHLFALANQLVWRRHAGQQKPVSDAEVTMTAADEAGLFLDILAASPVDLEGVDVIVLETNAYGTNDRSFLDALTAQLGRDELPEPWRRIRTVDVSSVLSREHYRVLDSHMQAAGHVLVAGLLEQALQH